MMRDEGSFMVWKSLSGFGTGSIIKLESVIDRIYYGRILSFAEDNMSLKLIFQRNNDPKLTKVVKDYFVNKPEEVWVSQNKCLAYPDFRPNREPLE